MNFAFFWANPKTDHESIKSTLFGSNPNLDFWDSQSERFFGKGFEKKFFCQAVFRKKERYAKYRCRTYMTSNWTNVGDALLILRHLLHIIPFLSSIQIIGGLFLNSYLSCFLYVCSVCLSLFLAKWLKNDSSASVFNSYNFTILRRVFYLRNVCFKPKYIHFVYSFVAFSSCLRREKRRLEFRPEFHPC